MDRDALVAHLDALLDPTRMPDHGPNGLQVEGASRLRRIAAAVTASQATIDEAVAKKADALIVHHGILWDRDAARPVAGWHGRRIRALLKADVNLIAYHLPLDRHPSLGNNAQLLAAMGLQQTGVFGDDGIGMLAEAKPRPVGPFVKVLHKALGRAPVLIPGDRRQVARIGVVSGAGQRQFEAAIEAGCDLFITGEASEYVTHLARETGTHYLWAGHHATERGGIVALARHVEEQFRVPVRFIDEDNPV